MTDSSNPRRQNEVLRQRISTLTAAILRISATLDLDTVLDEVVASACGLTGARYGVIVTVDEAGAPQDFVFSGVTPEEQQELLAWPGSGRLIQHLRELPGPLRVADLSAYTRSLGIEPAQTFSRTFQGMPMRHRGGGRQRTHVSRRAAGAGSYLRRRDEVPLMLQDVLHGASQDSTAQRRNLESRSGIEQIPDRRAVLAVGYNDDLVGRGRVDIDECQLHGPASLGIR